MQLSKLTFSLASLVLILALSLVVVPVEAAEISFGDTDNVPASGFAVVAADAAFDTDTTNATPDEMTGVTYIDTAELLDLEVDFRRSVLYTLLAPKAQKRSGTSDTEDGDAIMARDVVISEIMWGVNDAAASFAARTDEQFIELYSTVADANAEGANAATDAQAISLQNWELHSEHGEGIFYNMAVGATVKLAATDAADLATLTTPISIAGEDDTGIDFIIVDQVGNVELVGPWVVDIGQSGAVSGENAKDLISMYRNINYGRVEGTDDRWKNFPDGTRKGSWKASTAAYGVRRKGTPGAKHFVGLSVSAVDGIAYSPVIINEIGNNSNDNYDWLELRNVSDGEVNLKKWQIGEIMGTAETTLVQFPDNDKHKIPGKGILLIVRTDPHRDDDHPLAAGTRINDPKNLDTNPTATRYYVAGNDFMLMNSGKTLLVVRTGNDKKGTHEKISDLTGTSFAADDGKNTEIWPLRGRRKAGDDWGHGTVIKGQNADNQEFKEKFVYQRINVGRGVGKETWERRGYTGVGYKRSANDGAQNGGTPGFDNGAVKGKQSDLAGDAMVTISEIMYQTVRNAPQWIELHNGSKTQAVNLNEWKLKIETDRDDEGADIRIPEVTIQFGATIIPPDQTVIIVSTKSTQASDGIDEDHRIIDLWGTEKNVLEVDNRRFQLLSTMGFKLTLMQKGGDVVDTVGNLSANPAWELPMMTEDAEGRSSVIRRYDDGEARDGTMANGWVLASETGLPYHETYYGNRGDIGTPGYRGGGALPVSLSKFRPERQADGSIVVRWATESELDNAGFNILRSETRDGQFTKLNAQLIEGHGTTSERNTYDFVDTTAKPNVVYYYQIQDVSLDGDVTTLRTTHLRGNVSAAGKLTTIWGELKLQD